MSSSVLTLPIPPRPPARRFTCAEFHQMGDMGWFEGQRPVLIDGEILEMPGPNPPHATMTAKVDYTLRNYFTQGFVVRNQLPLVLGLSTDPEPDIAIVKGSLMDYFKAHPTTAELVIEVADSTLAFDMTHKASLYAAAKILDYWIVDLVSNRLHIYRDPQPDLSQPFRAKYKSVVALSAADAVSPLCQPQFIIPASDLLP